MQMQDFKQNWRGMAADRMMTKLWKVESISTNVEELTEQRKLKLAFL